MPNFIYVKKKKNHCDDPYHHECNDHTLATFSCETANGNAARFELVKKGNDNLLHF